MNNFFSLTFQQVHLTLISTLIEARYIEGRNFDPYEEVARRTGFLEKIEEFDRLIDTLVDLRSIDFGIVDSWKNAKPSYKGCEPLKTGKRPVKC